MDALLGLRLGPRPDQRPRSAVEVEDSRAATRGTLARIRAAEAMGGTRTESTFLQGSSSMEMESAAGGAVRVDEQRAQPRLEDGSLHLRAARRVGRPGVSILGRMLAGEGVAGNGGGPVPGDPTAQRAPSPPGAQEPV